MNKYFKKIALLCSIVAALSIGGASMVSNASAAANCAVHDSPIIYNGWLQHTLFVDTCTDVDMVQLNNQVGLSCGGITDLSYNPQHSHCASGPPTLAESYYGRQYVTFTGQAGLIYFTAPFCGGATHVVAGVGIFRIHAKSTNSWGSWHVAWGPNQAIVC